MRSSFWPVSQGRAKRTVTAFSGLLAFTRPIRFPCLHLLLQSAHFRLFCWSAPLCVGPGLSSTCACHSVSRSPRAGRSARCLIALDHSRSSLFVSLGCPHEEPQTVNLRSARRARPETAKIKNLPSGAWRTVALPLACGSINMGTGMKGGGGRRIAKPRNVPEKCCTLLSSR